MAAIALNYDPSIFNVNELDAAKSIILTPKSGITTDARWHKETPYLVSLIEQNCEITPRTSIVDYGCGIGRISKELIQKYCCRVVGVDISESMRRLAIDYVDSRLFNVVSPDVHIHGFDLAIAVWALQHVQDLELEIFRLYRALKSGGLLFVVNSKRRYVPTPGGWVDDGEDVCKRLLQDFQIIDMNSLSSSSVGSEHANRAFWALYRKD